MKPTSINKVVFAKRIAQDKEYRHWAVVHLFRNGQTRHEQTRHVTCDLNYIGFNAVDAPLLSALAEKIESGKSLSADEEAILQKKLPKYWRQFSCWSLLEPPRLRTFRKRSERAVVERRAA
jgi:hypothetical protein